MGVSRKEAQEDGFSEGGVSEGGVSEGGVSEDGVSGEGVRELAARSRKKTQKGRRIGILLFRRFFAFFAAEGLPLRIFKPQMNRIHTDGKR